MAPIRSTQACAFALLLASCGLNAPGSGERASYFPMEADRTWEYRLHEIAGDHAWRVAVRSRGPRFVPELGRVATIFDEEYPDQIVPVAFFLSEGFLQSNIGLGYEIRDRMAILPIGTQPMRLMPVPPRIGMQWTYSEEVFGATGAVPTMFAIRWTGNVESEEVVEVPAGRFRHCLRVVSTALHRTGDSDHLHRYRYVDWYAPNVGLVKSEYSLDQGARAITRLELIRFRRASSATPPIGSTLQLARASSDGARP